jgi:hypothetical protein
MAGSPELKQVTCGKDGGYDIGGEGKDVVQIHGVREA